MSQVEALPEVMPRVYTAYTQGGRGEILRMMVAAIEKQHERAKDHVEKSVIWERMVPEAGHSWAQLMELAR